MIAMVVVPITEDNFDLNFQLDVPHLILSNDVLALVYWIGHDPGRHGRARV